MVPGVPWNPLRSIDDRLNGTPLSSYMTMKTAAMVHLRMQKQINWSGRAGSFSQKILEMGMASKISLALRVQQY